MPILSMLDLPGLSARESAEPGFVLALAQVADRLGLDPNYLGAVMSLESGFNPAAVNAHGGATGLIQFMPATAVLVGTTTPALRAMTAIQQLPYVEAFYEKAGRAIHPETPGDYYMATFLPAYVGKPADFVIAERGMPVYEQNPGLDADKDGTLTVGDVWAVIDRRVADARSRAMFVVDTDAEKKSLPHAAVVPPPAPSSLSGSPSPSSGQPSGSSQGGARNMTSNQRELVVFAASCELEDFALLTETKDAAGIAARLAAYWANVLRDPAGAAQMVSTHKAWCGALALFCLHGAGLGLELRWDFSPPNYGFLWNLRELERGELPKPGDIAYLDKPYQHHAIVVEVEGENVHTIDGNQGAAEPIKTHEAPLHHWTAFYSIEQLLSLPEAA